MRGHIEGPTYIFMERDVLTLMLILVVTGLTLGVFLYVGAMFLQGYIYTEPSQELYWQAPAAAGVLTALLVLWAVLIVSSEGASTRDIPYDTLFRFSARVDRLKEPAPEIWAVRKDGEKRPYKRIRDGQTRYHYAESNNTSRPWKNDGVDGLELVIDGENYFYKRVQGSGGSYGEYVSDQGWVMKEFDDGPTGIPSIFRWGRFVMNLLLNFVHFLLWWLCLWLLLQFQWGHALGLGLALWLVFTLSLLPMLLNYAAEVAQSKAAAGQTVGATALAQGNALGSGVPATVKPQRGALDFATCTTSAPRWGLDETAPPQGDALGYSRSDRWASNDSLHKQCAWMLFVAGPLDS